MNRKKQYLLWTGVAGVLFLIVGVHDVLLLGNIDKSGFVIGLELLAGFLFVFNALAQWRKAG